MTDIYYGRIQHPWSMDIENWEQIAEEETIRSQEYKNNLQQHMMMS